MTGPTQTNDRHRTSLRITIVMTILLWLPRNSPLQLVGVSHTTQVKRSDLWATRSGAAPLLPTACQPLPLLANSSGEREPARTNASSHKVETRPTRCHHPCIC